MKTLLLHHAHLLATFDDQRREIADGAIFVRGNVIESIGTAENLPRQADCVIDATDHVVLPGLINTHHHLYQTLTRVLAQDANLFQWLQTLYPIWSRLTDESIACSTMVGLAELVLSGCTTSSDHLYLFPNDVTLDTQIRAAQTLGLRFHAARGAMSLGQSQGGLPPDALVESEAAILRDCQRVIETWHDPAPQAMTRIVVAPCSPFSVTPDLMRESAALARYYGVHLHTHLAETLDEEAFCIEKYHRRPVEYMQDLGWLGNDVWHAHCVHLQPNEVQRYGQTGTGVAHCPSSNMRLGSGIAPITALRAVNARIGLGVDGSASNDGGDLLAEARMAMLLQRIAPDRTPTSAVKADKYNQYVGNPMAISAREVLAIATRGGAEVLGRNDIGQLAVGMSADFIAVNLNRLHYSGAGEDPLAALVFCQSLGVDLVVINGRVIVRNGTIQSVEMAPIAARHRQISTALING